jgi:hypothetical protein
MYQAVEQRGHAKVPVEPANLLITLNVRTPTIHQHAQARLLIERWIAPRYREVKLPRVGVSSLGRPSCPAESVTFRWRLRFHSRQSKHWRPRICHVEGDR